MVAAGCRKRVAAVLVGFAVCLFLSLLSVLAVVVAAIPLIGLLLCIALAAGVGVAVWVRQNSLPRGAIVAGVPTVLLVVLWFVFPSFYKRWLAELIRSLGLFDRVSGFCAGHFDLSATVLYLSVIAVCLFFVAQMPIRLARKGGF